MVSERAALRRHVVGTALLGIAVAAGCGGKEPQVCIRNRAGSEACLTVEVARTEAERARGLSGRRHLADGEGMLIVVPHGPRTGFTGAGLLVPVSVAFLDGRGVILSIQDLSPGDANLYTIDAAYAFGLEAQAGWFAAQGIGIGDRVDLREAMH